MVGYFKNFLSVFLKLLKRDFEKLRWQIYKKYKKLKWTRKKLEKNLKRIWKEFEGNVKWIESQ